VAANKLSKGILLSFNSETAQKPPDLDRRCYPHNGFIQMQIIQILYY
jgi:hypothetical protein